MSLSSLVVAQPVAYQAAWGQWLAGEGLRPDRADYGLRAHDPHELREAAVGELAQTHPELLPENRYRAAYRDWLLAGRPNGERPRSRAYGLRGHVGKTVRQFAAYDAADPLIADPDETCSTARYRAAYAHHLATGHPRPRATHYGLDEAEAAEAIAIYGPAPTPTAWLVTIVDEQDACERVCVSDAPDADAAASIALAAHGGGRVVDEPVRLRIV